MRYLLFTLLSCCLTPPALAEEAPHCAATIPELRRLAQDEDFPLR